ncbi:MAG: hypothetical protein K9H16_02765 [Bacteroidales bacterium]|nr:hypothetical protein [Bacteroidales bacterium]
MLNRKITIQFDADNTLRNKSRILFRIFTLFLTVLLIYGNGAMAQQPETKTKVVNDSLNYHSAKRATLYSAVLPGLGQAYNKKYWKIPIIYAGFGTLIYFIGMNGSEYHKFRDAYNIVATGDTTNYYSNEYVVKYSANLTQLEEGRNYYRRNLELNYILTGLLYILNIIDASVDANLYNFDVSDDISLRFEPQKSQNVFARRPSMGLTLTMKF